MSRVQQCKEGAWSGWSTVLYIVLQVVRLYVVLMESVTDNAPKKRRDRAPWWANLAFYPQKLDGPW